MHPKKIFCNRFISALLAFMLLISVLPPVYADTAEPIRGLTLEELMDKFPDGKYWNGGDPDSWTETPCTHHGNCPYNGSCGCNSFMGLSIQCMGFAEKLGYDATGYNPRNNANGWYTYKDISALNKLKPGDIVRRNGHSMYVIGVNGENVTIADCNSRNRSCNIRWGATVTKTNLATNFEHVRSAPSELARGYADSCERYPSAGTVTVTVETSLYSLPCTSEIQSGSAVITTAVPDSQWGVTRVYLNEEGEYWYRTSFDGTVCYIPANDCSFTGITPNVTISSVVAPTYKQVGSFSLGGTITSENLNLSKVGAYVYEGNTIGDTTPWFSEDTPNKLSYSINGNKVDTSLKFSKIGEGEYTYVIRAWVTNNFVRDGALVSQDTEILLYQSTFTVSDSAPTSHSYVPVQSEEDVLTYACTTCDHSYTVTVYATDYMALCESYLSAGTVTVSTDTTLYSLPSSSPRESSAVTSAVAGSRWTVSGLYLNPRGDYWYKLQNNNIVCYLFAGDCVFQSDPDSVTIRDVSAPINTTQNSSFNIRGVISSKTLPLTRVGAYVYEGDTVSGTAPWLSEDTPNTLTYSISGNKVDSYLKFGQIPAGEYTYAIRAWVTNHHANGNTFTETQTEVLLYRSTFTVSASKPHSHTYTSQESGNCTENRVTTYSCTCGFSYTVTSLTIGEHSYGSWQTVLEPTYTAPGLEKQTCSVCGDSITRELPALDSPVTGWNLTLQHNISVGFHADLDNTDTVRVTVNGQDIPHSLTDGVISVNVAAAQMNDPIQIYVNGSALEKTYTVLEYAQTILSGDYSQETKDLISNMLLYGGAAQTYFGYNSDNLVSNGISAQLPVPQGTSTHTIQGSVSGIRFYGASLMHQDKIAVRFYFTGSIEGLTFTANSSTLTPQEKDGRYYVEIGGINPQDLDKAVTVTVSNGSNSLAVSYSPMDYILLATQRASTSENLKNLVQSLYGYHLAAKAYTN